MKNGEEATARPAKLVGVAVGAFEEVWRTRERPLVLLHVIATAARNEAETRLNDAPERPPEAALALAWGVVEPILERLLQRHHFLPETIKQLLAESGEAAAKVFTESP
jgi:hypothetical protein